MANALPIDDTDPHHALPRGTLLNDKFRLQRVIGVGGFGIVYLAHDEMSDVNVAIKEYMPTSLAGRTKTMQVSLISQSNAETFALGLRSFWNEARLLAKFRDEHLPLLKVYDAFQANGTAYMVMPVLRGRTAYQVRREMPKPPNERWLRTLLIDLLPALERLHAEKVYHRDIAPDNIQIDIHAKPVLLDLGAARHVIGNRTQSITAILKPGYAPIEQYGENESLSQGPWTDIYALGATIHFLLLNKPPPSATSRMFDVGKALVEQDIPGCSMAFLRVIDWMLAFRPEDRPQSVAQLRAALDESDPSTRIQAPKAVANTVARAQAPMPPSVIAPPAAPRAVPVALVPPPARGAVPALGTPQAAPPADDEATVVIAQPKIAEASAPTASHGGDVATAARTPAPASSAPRPRDPASVPSQPGFAPTAVEPARSKMLRLGLQPLTMVLAGLGALVLVGSVVAWLWPHPPVASAGAARPAPSGTPVATKPAPATAQRTQSTTLPASFTLAPVHGTPVAATDDASNRQIVADAPSAADAIEPAPAKVASAEAIEPSPKLAAPSTRTPSLAAKRAPSPAPSPSPASKKALANDRNGALLPQPAEPVTVAAAPSLPPPPAPDPPPVASAAAPAPPAIASPSERCSHKDGFARTLCVSLVCGVPELHNHPECVAIRRR